MEEKMKALLVGVNVNNDPDFETALTELESLAEACGYETVGHAVTTKEELIEAIEALRDCGKASFIDCRIHKGLTRKLPPIIFDHREAIDKLIDELNG